MYFIKYFRTRDFIDNLSQLNLDTEMSIWQRVGMFWSLMHGPITGCAEAIKELPVLRKMIEDKFKFDAVVAVPAPFSSCPG